MQKNIIFLIFDEGNRSHIVLYETLVRAGFGSKVIYYLNDNAVNLAALNKFVKSNDPLFLGFSFASHSVQVAFSVGASFTKEFPGVPLIFGGAHPTIDPLSCLEYCDAVCVGEGEGAILEIAEKLTRKENYLSSHNLIYKKDGNIVKNAMNSLIADLDTLPVRRPFTKDHFLVSEGRVLEIDRAQYLKLFPDGKTRFMQVYSRGCPNACSYCCNSLFRSIYPDWPKVRIQSAEATIKEMQEMLRINPSIIRMSINDDCFLGRSSQWLKDFVQKYNAAIGKELNYLTCPEHVTLEKLRILNDIDVRYISIGLQSGSKKTNALYNRPFSSERFLSACNLIHAQKIGLVVHMIFDNPWEDADDIFDTLDVLTQIKKPFYILQFSLKIYPGTKLYEHCIAKSLNMLSYNTKYEHYYSVQRTDINRIITLAQFLPRCIIFSFFKNREKATFKILVRLAYFFAAIYMPFHVLRICGSRRLRDNIAIALSHGTIAERWVKGKSPPSCSTKKTP